VTKSFVGDKEQFVPKTANPPSEMTILRRVVDAERRVLSKEAARSILRLCFGASDRNRMNRLAARNRDGKLTKVEEEEFNNYIRVGQTLGILQSKARRALKTPNGKSSDE
jgi:hypothetical protein